MYKDNVQEYKIEEVNKPTEEETKRKIEELCKFLEKTWEIPIQNI